MVPCFVQNIRNEPVIHYGTHSKRALGACDHLPMAMKITSTRPKASQIQRARHLKSAPEPKETVLRERMKSCINQDRLEEMDVHDLAERLLMLEVVGAEVRVISAALSVCDKISERFNLAKRNPRFSGLTAKSPV